MVSESVLRFIIYFSFAPSIAMLLDEMKMDWKRPGEEERYLCFSDHSFFPEIQISKTIYYQPSFEYKNTSSLFFPTLPFISFHHKTTIIYSRSKTVKVQEINLFTDTDDDRKKNEDAILLINSILLIMPELKQRWGIGD